MSPYRTMTKGIKLIFRLAAHCANVLPLCLAGFTLDVKQYIYRHFFSLMNLSENQTRGSVFIQINEHVTIPYRKLHFSFKSLLGLQKHNI